MLSGVTAPIDSPFGITSSNALEISRTRGHALYGNRSCAGGSSVSGSDLRNKQWSLSSTHLAKEGFNAVCKGRPDESHGRCALGP